jgi:subfamily B ATP-binding cassette protein MsbA
MEMSYAQISRYAMGDLQMYMSETNAVSNSIDQINTLVQTVLTTAVYLIVLLWLSWPMTLAALVALGLLSFMLRGIISHVRVIARRLNDLSKSMNISIAQFLQGLRLLRTFAREEFAIGKMDQFITDSEKAARLGHIWGISLGPIMESITVIGIALFLVGGYLFLGAESTSALPRLVAFILVMSRLIPRVMSINNSLVSINNYWPSVERVSGILASEDKEYIRDGGRPFSGLQKGVEFRQVSLHYVEGESPAVIDLNFSIPRGSMVALAGESGAGKSTTVDLLLRLYDPSSGQILVDGVELPELDLKAWRSHLSTVSQDPFVFNDSIRANIAFGKLGASDDEIVAAAQAANAHEFILQLAQEYDTIIGDRGHRLSGGQRQRITLARAILRNPDILILDEATSDLDSQSERLIQEALDGLRRECTVVAVAHRLSTINMADQILVLSKGRLVERGTHDELLTLNGHYARFWYIQSNVPKDVHV